MKTQVILFRKILIVAIISISFLLAPPEVLATNRSAVTIHLSGMTPHVGQIFEARLINKYDLKEVDRVMVPVVPAATFDIVFNNAEMGQSYFIDMFADLNQNDIYDAPPADHAWRLSVNTVQGDETINFSHNVNFTDIKWRYMLTLNMNGMTPHVGQHFEARVVDINRNFKETGRSIISAIPSESFSVSLPYLESGHSYYIEFFADLNHNGRFDPAPTDHTWRLELMNITGDTSLSFSHNINFTDLPWKDQLTVVISGLDTHIGKRLSLRVKNSSNGQETGRYYRNIDLPEIAVSLPALSAGINFQADFYIDDNNDGIYDPPPQDHAWRLENTDNIGNTTLNFSHNEIFTDINWKYMITLEAMNMNPHIGQLVELKVYNSQTSEVIGLVSVANLLVPHIYIEVPGSSFNENYNIDFYADLNQSGGYDPPPIDHAWRITLDPSLTDTTVEFVHNTNFTDINWNVGIAENLTAKVGFQVFPNPTEDYAILSWLDKKYPDAELKIFAITGALVISRKINQNDKIDIINLPDGMYEAVTVFNDGNWAAVPLVKK